ncbi:MAG: Crp/Fnr family transcriptional regulator [Nitrospiria bacterium]
MKGSKPVPVPDCRRCEARAISAFCGKLNEDGVGFLSDLKKSQFYKKDQALFYEGNTCDGIYILCSGSVKLVQSSREGHQQLLEIVSPGGWVDKGAVFSSGRYFATAQALEDSSVSLILREDITRILKRAPDFALTMITSLSREVEKGGERIRQLTTQGALERLAGVLLDLSRHHGVETDGGILIRLALKREELAEMVCVTQETVVRLLTGLKKDGLIQLNGKEITILDDTRLSRMID